MEAILSLSFGLLSLAKREETIYGTWMSQNLSQGSDTLDNSCHSDDRRDLERWHVAMAPRISPSVEMHFIGLPDSRTVPVLYLQMLALLVNW